MFGKKRRYSDERGMYGNGYNTEYHAHGTAFDRMGAGMLNRRNNRRSDDYYDDGYGYQPGAGAYGMGMQTGRRTNNGYYKGVQDAQNMQRMNAMNNQNLEYDTATLAGKYYSLDNPKTDVREYPERNENET